MRRRLLGLMALTVTGVAVGGCDELSEVLAGFLEPTGPRQLSDDDAFRHLRPDRSAAPEEDMQSVMKAMDVEVAREQGENPPMDDPKVVALLRKAIQPRLNIDEDAFERIDPDQFFGPDDELPSEKNSCSFDLDSSLLMANDFVIPQVEKLPVRNQLYRGTCAAFAGIMTVEYAALNQQTGPASNLPTLDLSEQYFYWSSKPECQTSNSCKCPGCGEGSWYGRGFGASFEAGSLDIPLEADCSYTPRQGNHDTMHPLPSGCSKGAVKVEEVDAWCGVDELIGLLHQGYAVPWGSPLSDNWERNDGLITKKGFEGSGSTVHAGGHAYNIVGYRRLPNMPEEGGMCFIIKNSWGTGWGVNGYSCMTLAWMRAVTFDGFLSRPQPVALRVVVRDDLMNGELPDEGEADQESDTNEDLPVDVVEEDEDEKLPPQEPDVNPTPDPPPTPDPEPEPEPEPEPQPVPEAWVTERLYGPNEAYFKVQTQVVQGELLIRGLLLGDGGESLPFRVKQGRSGNLIYKGDVVGRKTDKDIRLCTAEFGHLCSLRFRGSDKQIYIQFRDDDLRSVQPEETTEEKGSWLSANLGGRDYGVFVPKTDSDQFTVNPKTFLRLGNSEPARFSLQPTLSDLTNVPIKLQGNQVGLLKIFEPTNSSLCSGDFGEQCNILNGEQLSVVPRNTGKLANLAR